VIIDVSIVSCSLNAGMQMLTPRSYVLERGVEDIVGVFGRSIDAGFIN